MIQRIQSIFLLLVAVLNSLLFSFPLNEMINGKHIIRLSILGLYDVTAEKDVLIADLFPLLAIVSVSIILSLTAIFLYKNRRLQMRFSIYNSILGLATVLLTLFYAYQVSNTNQSQLGFSIGLLFPIIGSLFSFLAYKAIKKDDNLIKSVDRIR